MLAGLVRSQLFQRERALARDIRWCALADVNAHLIPDPAICRLFVREKAISLAAARDRRRDIGKRVLQTIVYDHPRTECADLCVPKPLQAAVSSEGMHSATVSPTPSATAMFPTPRPNTLIRKWLQKLAA